jgi:hypothetical protein
MLNLFNNKWILLISIIIIYVVIKKIYYLNKPFNEEKFIKQQINKNKLKNKIKNIDIQSELYKGLSYYIGLN